jgi:dihydrofolate synthase/folylpolyglutamate synthase
MLQTKDAAGFLQNFVGLARRLIAVPMHQDKALPPEALAGIAREIGIPADASDSLAAALAGIGGLGLVPAPRIIITGSLYLAGEALAANGTWPE